MRYALLIVPVLVLLIAGLIYVDPFNLTSTSNEILQEESGTVDDTAFLSPSPIVTMTVRSADEVEKSLKFRLFDSEQVYRPKCTQAVAWALPSSLVSDSSVDEFRMIEIEVFFQSADEGLDSEIEKANPDLNVKTTSTYSSVSMVYIVANDRSHDAKFSVVISQDPSDESKTVRSWGFDRLEQAPTELSKAIRFTLELSNVMFSDLINANDP